MKKKPVLRSKFIFKAFIEQFNGKLTFIFKNAVLYLFVWLTKFDEIDPRTTSFYNCTLERRNVRMSPASK